MLATPQATWLNAGSPGAVEAEAHAVILRSAATRSVPVVVAYDIPGRDCAQYSAGGAVDAAAYAAWIAAVARGIGAGEAVVILEPDALGELPSDCAGYGTSSYPFTDAERLAEIRDGVDALEADPNVNVYLDGTNSDWQRVGTIAERLVEAGVQHAQGFFLNVGNYQYTSNNIEYGTWVADCIAYATAIAPGRFARCPDQYSDGGPRGGLALSPYGVWSTSSATPDLNTSAITDRYVALLGKGVARTHFVIDTSRNGDGPNDLAAYAAPPYDQSASTLATLRAGSWCDPPGAGVGLAPTASTGHPLVDAYLWVKIPGQSDGQCDSAGGVRAWNYATYNPWKVPASVQGLFDPLWGQVAPSSGAWFPAQALQLAEEAVQSPTAPGNG